jgi:hypothetical protein
MTIDLANFYLNTPMERFEYMRIPLCAIPDCIMDQYNLKPLIHNGSVMVKIRACMASLKLEALQTTALSNILPPLATVLPNTLPAYSIMPPALSPSA